MVRALQDPSEVIDLIQDKLPALFFVFGRAKCEELAIELSRQWDFLYADEKEKVQQIIASAEADHPDMFVHRDRAILKKLLLQGIGYHHAGLSPALKRIVERLYESRLIWVLFCTETFAAGVNFPAASAVFESCRKWDGREFRSLLNREFFQMAGRAGRRGFDEQGYVYIQISEDHPEETGFFKESGVEMVHGRLTVSANTVLSLLMWKTDEEIEHFLKSNFSAFQKRRRLKDVTDKIMKINNTIREMSAYYCEERDSTSCPLLHKKLKREMHRLKSRKYRQRPGSQTRIKEIQRLLKSLAKKKCQQDRCFEATAVIREMNSKLDMLQLKKKQLGIEARQYTVDFQKMRRLLERLGYIKGRELLPRGKFALHLHIQEIFVTELVFSGLIDEMPADVVAGVLAGVDYVPGRREYVQVPPYDFDAVNQLRAELMEMGVPQEYMVWSPVPGYLAHAWYNGKDFDHLLENSSLQEGDLVSIIRRTIDLLRQLEKAAEGNLSLQEKIRGIRRTLDRDQVAVLF
ncbi:helicase-related protein [Desulfofalx alkaliphila]|uniref:helicase-related protein n=1 Tax=Desulfofalx alkaliphila TaxID=105483 RepID=UPI0004E18224|nr:helicase-related protein [Desulfofalx alkaliphila]